MVEFVADDGIVLPEQRFKNTAIGVEAGYVKDSIFCAEELRNFFLEFFMDILCAADKTHRAHAVPAVIDSLVGGFDDFGM